jgi:hypothetical protein
MILRARIIEIPAHLDWTEQNKIGTKRKSGMRFVKTFYSGLMAGFIFRPYIYYLAIGLVLLILALYMIVWIFINTFRVLSEVTVQSEYFDDKFSYAIGLVFDKHPHAFLVGGITLLAAIQVLSLSFISLQNKRYFDELFHLGSSIIKDKKKIDYDNKTIS